MYFPQFITECFPLVLQMYSVHVYGFRMLSKWTKLFLHAFLMHLGHFESVSKFFYSYSMYMYNQGVGKYIEHTVYSESVPVAPEDVL